MKIKFLRCFRYTVLNPSWKGLGFGAESETRAAGEFPVDRYVGFIGRAAMAFTCF